MVHRWFYTTYANTFIMRKGNSLAPVLLPRDCDKATMLLADVCMYFIWQNLTAPAENMLAYAMIIHKAQGMTLDSIVVDCSSVCTPAHGTCKHVVCLLFSLSDFWQRRHDRNVEVYRDVPMVGNKPKKESVPDKVTQRDFL